jgi:hypothetical protein
MQVVPESANGSKAKASITMDDIEPGEVAQAPSILNERV